MYSQPSRIAAQALQAAQQPEAQRDEEEDAPLLHTFDAGGVEDVLREREQPREEEDDPEAELVVDDDRCDRWADRR